MRNQHPIADARTGRIRKQIPQEIARDPLAARSAIGVEGGLLCLDCDALMRSRGYGGHFDNRAALAIALSVGV